MASLISTYGISTVIIIFLVGIPALFNFIKWCKGIYATREKFKQDNINKGKEIEARAESKENRLQQGESRMTQLETDVRDLKILVQQQAKMIELLIQSDELDIKSWIKMQHEKWIPRKCIDSQTLDLLEQRFSVYEKEGGNSWALKLVNELRALPTVTVVPISEIHEDQ